MLIHEITDRNKLWASISNLDLDYNERFEKVMGWCRVFIKQNSLREQLR